MRDYGAIIFIMTFTIFLLGFAMGCITGRVFSLNRDEITIGVVKQKVGDNLEVEDIIDKKLYNVVKSNANINDTIYLNKQN